MNAARPPFFGCEESEVMPCQKGGNCDSGPVSLRTAIVALVLVGVFVGAYVFIILPASTPPMSITFYVRDAAGQKHVLSRSFFINGIEATSIGVDYSFTVTGAPSKVTIHVKLWDVTGGHIVILPTGAGAETIFDVLMDTRSGPYTGSKEWTCSEVFASSQYQDGASHSFAFKATAQAYSSAGSGIGAQLSSDSLTFTEKYDPGGLTSFNIYV
jgi:hypothetical protein